MLEKTSGESPQAENVSQAFINDTLEAATMGSETGTTSEKTEVQKTEITTEKELPIRPTSEGMILLPSGEPAGKISPDFGPIEMEEANFRYVPELLEGKCAGLHFKGIETEEWCQNFAERFVNDPRAHFEEVVPPIYTVGQHLYACGAGATIECYFNELKRSNEILDQLLQGKPDPVISFIESMAEARGLQFEKLQFENMVVDHGTLRLWGGSKEDPQDGLERAPENLTFFALPHEDLKETNSQHPMLTQIRDTDNIYAVILCLDAVEGREPRTILYDKELQLEELRAKENKSTEGSYGITTEILKDANATAISLQPGDIGIFPAHNMHCVVGFQEALRCTLSGFIHFKKDEEGNPTKIIFRT